MKVRWIHAATQAHRFLPEYDCVLIRTVPGQPVRVLFRDIRARAWVMERVMVRDGYEYESEGFPAFSVLTRNLRHRLEKIKVRGV